MIKNIKWGAVAYLKQSKYGLGTIDIARNSSESRYTGGGKSDAYKTNIAQSTTGNIYGVYDMAGGAQELIMLTNKSNISSLDGIDSKYYDVFNSTTQLGWIQYQEEITDITTEQLWITAGATSTETDANIFKTSYYDGNSQTDTTFRIVLS